MTHPVIDEAMKKAAVAWVAAGDHPPVVLWCLSLDGALYVVSGPGEQTAPGLAHATDAIVSLRGDHGGRIVRWVADVTQVDPRSEEWETVAPQLAGKRLNAPSTADELVARWARECVINRLVPVGDPIEPDGAVVTGEASEAGLSVEAGAGPTAGSEAEPPRETPAARRTRAPFRLHRVRRRA
jgi:hypothetical protein